MLVAVIVVAASPIGFVHHLHVEVLPPVAVGIEHHGVGLAIQRHRERAFQRAVQPVHIHAARVLLGAALAAHDVEHAVGVGVQLFAVDRQAHRGRRRRRPQLPLPLEDRQGRVGTCGQRGAVLAAGIARPAAPRPSAPSKHYEPGETVFHKVFGRGMVTRVTPAAGDSIVDAQGLYLSHGFVDAHVHGGGGYDFMDGTPEAWQGAARLHLTHGTTCMVPTTLASTKEELLRAFSVYNTCRNNSGSGALVCRLSRPLTAPTEFAIVPPLKLNSVFFSP